MDALTSILGPLVLIGPLAAVVVWLMVATRRPSCLNCHYGVSQDAATCPHCGEKLASEKRPQRRVQSKAS